MWKIQCSSWSWWKFWLLTSENIKWQLQHVRNNNRNRIKRFSQDKATVSIIYHVKIRIMKIIFFIPFPYDRSPNTCFRDLSDFCTWHKTVIQQINCNFRKSMRSGGEKTFSEIFLKKLFCEQFTNCTFCTLWSDRDYRAAIQNNSVLQIIELS